jgi:hypothetical protein
MRAEYLENFLWSIGLYFHPGLLLLACIAGGYLTCLLCRYAHWRRRRVLRFLSGIAGAIAGGIVTLLFASVGFSLSPGTFAYIDGSELFLTILITSCVVAFMPGLVVAWSYVKRFGHVKRMA